MKIIFIRHGETTGDVENRYGRDYDDHLSPKGIEQSNILAEELKGKNIELIVCSPLVRAKESAEIVSQGNYPIVIEQKFKERNSYGFLTGKNKSEAIQEYPDLVEKLKDRFYIIEGGESYEDFKNRIQNAFNQLVSDSKHSCVAVLWHGGPMRVLFRDVLQKGELGKEIGDCAWVELENDINGDFEIKDSKRIEFLF